MQDVQSRLRTSCAGWSGRERQLQPDQPTGAWTQRWLAINENFSSILRRGKLKIQEVRNVGGDLFCTTCTATP